MSEMPVLGEAAKGDQAGVGLARIEARCTPNAAFMVRIGKQSEFHQHIID